MRWLFLFLLAAPFAAAQESDNPRARQDYFFEQRRYPSGRIPDGARLKAIADVERMNAAAGAPARKRLLLSADGEWQLAGPQPTRYPNAGSYVTSGRIAAVAIDPRDNNVVYAGAASGGVWKTTDGGQNWRPLTDSQPTLATGSIAIDPLNPDTVYVGTGEENFSADSYYGAGILKSTNGGQSWRNIVGPFVRARIGALAIHPRQTNILLAAADLNGLYRSADGGETWSSVLAGAAATSVVFDPVNPNVAWAALGAIRTTARNGIYKSNDAGQTWTIVTGTSPDILPTANVGRIELAVSPSNPDTVYALIVNGSAALLGNLLGLYRTNDGGQRWVRVDVTDFCNTQCWYNVAVRVHPANPDIVFAGGVTLRRSLNGGQTWTTPNSGTGLIHVDQHAFVFTNDGSRFYVGNDGGMWSSTDYSNNTIVWDNLNQTLSITQFYPGHSFHPTNPDIGLGGTQDNGTQRYSGTLDWNNVTCGDGGWTAIDPTVPAIAYGTCQNLDIRRSLNVLGTTWNSGLIRGIDAADRIRFISAFVMDPSIPQRLYFGTHRLYRSNDGGGRWDAISGDLTNNSSTLSAIAIAPGDSRIIYTASASGRVFVSTDDGANWTDRTAGLPNRAITQIAVDSIDPGKVYVTLSGFGTGHVFRSDDFGATWTNISSNLPDFPVNDLIVDPDIPDAIYIATDVGVLATTNRGQSWATLGTGLPNVVVHAIKLHRPSRRLRAATHGRSMWDVLLTPAPGTRPQITSLTPANRNAGEGAFVLAIEGSGFGTGSRARWNGEDRNIVSATNSRLEVQIPASDIEGAGRAAITVFTPSTGGGLSNAMNFAIGPAPSIDDGGIVSAAFPTGEKAVAPGMAASLYGRNLAPRLVIAPGGALPVTLGGVTLSTGGFITPMYFVSPTQINFQVPWTLGSGTMMVAVFQGTTVGTPSPVRIQPFVPTLFTLNQQGTGQGAIRIANSTTIAAPEGTVPDARPVARGGFIEIYGTGLGNVSNRPATGGIALSSPLSRTLTPVTVSIGGQTVDPAFAGLTPGTVGLYQINIQVPENITPGDAVPIIVTIGGIQSNTVTVAVQ